MIREILQVLASNDFIDVNDDDIQFAKGAYEVPLSFKDLKIKQKRRKALRNVR